MGRAEDSGALAAGSGDPAAETPNVARMYDYYLGGAANFGSDRALADQVIALRSDVPAIARANRAFLRRAVLFAVSAGVRQFLDLGSGVPTVGNVHQVALDVDPRCRVVYVDHEEVAAAYARELVADQPGVGVVQADIRDVDAVLGAETTTGLIDFDEPVAVLAVAVLHFLSEADRPAELLARYRAPLAAGGLLAVSHGTVDQQPPEVAAAATALYQDTTTPVTLRSRDQVADLFAGTRVVEPGVVFAPQWRPEGAGEFQDAPHRSAFYAAVGVIDEQSP